jgi:hypothetical protein
MQQKLVISDRNNLLGQGALFVVTTLTSGVVISMLDAWPGFPLFLAKFGFIMDLMCEPFCCLVIYHVMCHGFLARKRFQQLLVIQPSG